MPVRTVTRRTDGQQIKLVLNPALSDFHTSVVIEIPDYNARFTFVRKVEKRNAWVEVSERQAIDPDRPSTLHVSKTPYWGMATWACAILNARYHQLKSGDKVVVQAQNVLWDVFWRSGTGDQKVAQVTAASERQATRKGWGEWTGGHFPSLTFDLMYSAPHAREKELWVGVNEYQPKPVAVIVLPPVQLPLEAATA